MNTIQTIDGVALPCAPVTPNGYTVVTSDLDSDATGRSAETGVLMRYVIRKNIHKISLSFRTTAANASTIRGMVSPNKITVVFWDLTDWATAYMYVSDRSVKLLPVPGQAGWYDLSFNLIEY